MIVAKMQLVEALVNPFPEAVCDAANVGAHGSCWPPVVFLSFVYFIGDIELPKWVLFVVSHVLYDVLTV